jgi:multidrug efflux pump subunit AcrB
MSNFFISRPIVAMVIAILMVIVGAVTIAFLPIAQFPNIAPPEIRLQATYPGADAKTLEDSVAVPIEQQVNGVDNMTYMYSLNATFNQQTTLIVDFDLKTDANTDLLLTQSREQLATGQLPPEVNSYGVALKNRPRRLSCSSLCTRPTAAMIRHIWLPGRTRAVQDVRRTPSGDCRTVQSVGWRLNLDNTRWIQAH